MRRPSLKHRPISNAHLRGHPITSRQNTPHLCIHGTTLIYSPRLNPFHWVEAHLENGWPSWGCQPNIYAPSMGPSGPSIPGLRGKARPSRPHRPTADTSSRAPIDAVNLTPPNDPQPSLVPLGKGQWDRTTPMHCPRAFTAPLSYGILGECQAPSTRSANGQHSIMGPYQHCRPHPAKVYSGLPMSIGSRPLVSPGPLEAIGTTTLHHPRALLVPLSYALGDS